ncbi:uncharacterized protein J3R85_015625 [Psidium guajava]|nr:uncharacterized protein J3R85_015625 [Psidium guajava]
MASLLEHPKSIFITQKSNPFQNYRGFPTKITTVIDNSYPSGDNDVVK